MAADADVKVIHLMLGRADASMTLKTYEDLWPDRLAEVREAISACKERAVGAGAHG